MFAAVIVVMLFAWLRVRNAGNDGDGTVVDSDTIYDTGSDHKGLKLSFRPMM